MLRLFYCISTLLKKIKQCIVARKKISSVKESKDYLGVNVRRTILITVEIDLEASAILMAAISILATILAILMVATLILAKTTSTILTATTSILTAISILAAATSFLAAVPAEAT